MSGQLTIVQPGDAGRDDLLCGRPVSGWVADTATALRAGSRQYRGTREVTVVLSWRYPLLLAATVGRAVQALSHDCGGSGLDAVLIRAPGAAPWWSDQPARTAVAALAYSSHLDDCSGWLTQREPVDARFLQARLHELGARVSVIDASPAESLRTDDPVERQLAEAALHQKIAVCWQRRGVVIDDPATTRIDGCVQIGRGTRIRPHTELTGRTVIGAGATIGPVTTIADTRVGDGCLIRYAVCDTVSIGDNANIGPFTWLRSGTRLGARIRVGSFVELADSVMGDDSQIPHCGGLLGAVVGKNCNIAGLSGTANFDGQSKQRITIGDHVSIGASNMLIAPLTIGDGAYTAAGSILTGDVPSGALAISRTPQTNVEGWVARKMPGSPAALAAQRTGD